MDVVFRVCAEWTRPAELLAPPLRRLLRRFGVSPLLAAPHDADDGAVLDAVGRLAADDDLVSSGVWPLLPREQGYWPSERNHEAFAVRVERLLSAGKAPPWLLVDLEPPIAQMSKVRTAFAAGVLVWSNLNLRRYAGAVAAYRTLADKWRGAGVRTFACAAPLAAGDLPRNGATFWQDAWEAPLVGVGWDAVGCMTYTTLMSAYSSGALDHRGARRFAYHAGRATVRRFGGGAAAFVGLLGRGVLGDEPVYTDPDQLRLDVAALRAAGVRDIVLYSLEGLLVPEPSRALAPRHGAGTCRRTRVAARRPPVEGCAVGRAGREPGPESGHALTPAGAQVSGSGSGQPSGRAAGEYPAATASAVAATRSSVLSSRRPRCQ